MPDIPPLAALGCRIVVLGPTNAGKSTLAEALSARLGVPAIHLDRFRHLPGTDWQVRPDAEFKALHDRAIRGDGWVMDGNYSALMPQRLARASGAIVLDDHFLRRGLRYFNRTLLQKRRAGDLGGHRDSIKWTMLEWVWKTRHSGPRYLGFAQAAALPLVFCRNRAALDALYRAWGLHRT